jgi:two-component system, OmpR family, response regulator MtrA
MDASVRLTEPAAAQVPLVVCVSADPAVRQRVVRQLDGGGVLLMCPDLDALRAVLGGPALSQAPLSEGTVEGAAVVTMGELMVDARSMQVVWRGRTLPLTRLECELVSRLATPPTRVWTYDRLFSAVWGGTYLGDNSILHATVKRLRRKLRAVDSDALVVETVRGVGYRLAA